MKFVLLLSLFLVISFSQDSIINQIEKSIFFPNSDDHKIALCLSIQNFNNKLEKYISGNIWISDNLAINSSISPNSFNNDFNLYYNTSITYIPLIFKSDIFSSNLNFGMHRFRFYKKKSFRWYNFMLSTNFKFKNHNLILSWIYLSNIKKNHFIDISYKNKIYKNLFLFIGSKIYSEIHNLKFQPTIKLLTIL